MADPTTIQDPVFVSFKEMVELWIVELKALESPDSVITDVVDTMVSTLEN